MFMLEKAVVGSRRYWGWIGGLMVVILWGFFNYLRQLNYGLGLTGLSRDVTWGLYIGQFTFLVGVAASAVMVVLPYYLHNYKEFGRMTVLGECLAVSAVTACMLFIFVDMGQPMRVLNIMIYVHLNSMMFWDMISLSGYLVLNALITLVSLHAHQERVAPPKWLRAVIVLSIPWAVSIHTVTAFLYSGLPGRPFWMTAILAPRFLASAFASGPALLILLCMLVRRLSGYDVGRRAINELAIIVTYASILNVFFLLMELFTAYYSQIPALMEHFQSMYLGRDLAGMKMASSLTPWGQSSVILMAGALVLLLIPRMRRNHATLAAACVLTFVSLLLDKGVCLVVCGFMPSPLGVMAHYTPTLPEISISAGIWAIGALMVTVFYKAALSVEAAADVEFVHGVARESEAA
ncbi:MAG: NrfD/PsrC family molybdoenzyme membrane anchor subunit [Candidatus Binataceae bacterium]